MLNRIIGGFLIAIVSIPLILLGESYFQAFCGILGILALKELVDLKKHHESIPNFIYLVSIICLSLIIILFRVDNSFSFNFNYTVIALTILFLLIPCIFYQEKNYSAHSAIYLIGNIIFLGIFFNTLIRIREANIYHLLYLIFISIFTDIFALLVGKLIGKHKCRPNISPNKTWEGSIGGVLFGSVISILFYLKFINNISIFKVVIVTIILSVVGSFGDLVLSKIKRENDIKDFSNIIIGHGGILDRVDSLVFIVYTYTLIFSIII